MRRSAISSRSSTPAAALGEASPGVDAGAGGWLPLRTASSSARSWRTSPASARFSRSRRSSRSAISRRSEAGCANTKDVDPIKRVRDSSRIRTIEQLLQFPAYLRGRARLGEEGRDAEASDALRSGRVGVGANDNDGDAAMASDGTYARDQLETVHVGHIVF